MYSSVRFDDLEKAIAAIREKTHYDIFRMISGNAYGDFIFDISENETYLVKSANFSVWYNYCDGHESAWREVK